MPENRERKTVEVEVGRYDALEMLDDIQLRQDLSSYEAVSSYLTSFLGLLSTPFATLFGVTSLASGFAFSETSSMLEDLEDFYDDIYEDISETEKWMNDGTKKYYVIEKTFEYRKTSNSRPGQWHQVGMPEVVRCFFTTN